MSSDREREDEYSKFMPTNELKYEIVASSDKDKEHYQRKPSSIESYTSSTGDHHDKSGRKGIYHQILATCAVLLLSAGCGMPIGYSAVLLPQLITTIPTTTTMMNATEGAATISYTTTTEIAIDIEMGSWIASVHSLATPLGSLLSGPLADFLGRRKALLVSVFPIFLGWSVLGLAQSYTMLIIGRILCGFATGILGGPAQIYIAETAEPDLRGLLIGAPFVSYSLGIMIVYALGSALHWRAVAWCGNILPICALVAIYFIPESPVWLLRNKKVQEAHKALKFLRGNEIVAQKEINEMSERLKKERETTTENENIFQLCCKRVAIKPLFIVIGFSLLQMFSGTFIVVFYAIDIISEFGGNFNTRAAAIWTAVVRTICSLIFCVVLRFVRRRRILTVSGIGSGVSCLVLSVYMYARVSEQKSSTDVFVAAACLLSYIAFNTALMVMPATMVGEMFPARIRGRTAGGVFAAMNCFLFCLTKAFPYIQSQVKMRGVFMIFGVSSFLVSLFMFMFQPETMGRTLEQIEDYFNENNWLWFRRDKRYKQVATQADAKNTKTAVAASA